VTGTYNPSGSPAIAGFVVHYAATGQWQVTRSGEGVDNIWKSSILPG